MASNGELTGIPVSQPSVPVETVNFHLWQPCNMHCYFCFATFRDVRDSVLPEGHLPQRQAEHVVALLAAAGFRKITFAGGEPLLCPWIVDLVALAKDRGLTTSVVTNGSLLDDQMLKRLSPCLDWATISIDSLRSAALRETGRLTRGRPMLAEDYRRLCDKVAASEVRLKINTVVTRANWQEDLSDFIISVAPRRWKIFQVLSIEGQNSGRVDPFLITGEEFDHFLRRHEKVASSGIPVVPESNDQMLASYAMVDPAGRFFDDVGADGHTYSEPIAEAGVAKALSQVSIFREKFLARGGLYDD